MLLKSGRKYKDIQVALIAIVYGAAAFTTAIWLDNGLSYSAYVNTIDEIAMHAGLVGSAIFALATVTAFFGLRPATLVGLVATCVSLPHFAPMVVGLSTTDIRYLVRHGSEMPILALLSWLLAALYSLVNCADDGSIPTSRKRYVIRRAVATSVYAITAVTTGRWLTYPGQVPSRDSPMHLMSWVAMVGSGMFGLAFIVSWFRFRNALFLGLVAGCVSSVYVAPVLADLPWSDPAQLLKHGGEQVVIGFLWLLATVYSLIETWNSSRSRPPR